MSEAALWSNMRVKMHKVWQEATRHEDALQSGIADVSFVIGGRHGWMELKQIDAWPKRESTIVRCDHYTTAQRIWLKRKGRVGGCTWLFAKIGRDYLLFDWLAAQDFGTLPKRETLELANRVWLGRMDWAALGTALADGENW